MRAAGARRAKRGVHYKEEGRRKVHFEGRGFSARDARRGAADACRVLCHVAQTLCHRRLVLCDISTMSMFKFKSVENNMQ